MDTPPRTLQPEDLGIGRLFGAVRDAVVVADVESGRIVLWNPAAEAMFGYSALEAIGSTVELLIVPEGLRSAHREGMAHFARTRSGALVDSGTVVSVPAKRKDGQQLRVELALGGMLDAPGGAFVLATLRDVNERHQADQQLALSQQWLVEAQTIAHVGSWEWEVATDHVTWSAELYSIYGLDEATFAATYAAFLERIHPDDREAVRLAVEATVAEGVPLNFERRIVRPDGEVRILHGRGQLIRDAQGQPQRLVGTAQDVTDRVEAEGQARLLAQQQALAAERAAVLEQITEGVMIADASGKLTFVNAAARKIHGGPVFGLQALAPRRDFELLTLEGEAHPARDLPLARAALRGETVVDAQWQVRRPDGSQVIVQGSAAPVLGSSGEQVGAVLVLRDVTAQALLDRQKDEFLASAAHDLNNPLTAVKGTAQLLRRYLARAEQLDIDRLQHGLDGIERAASRMATLLDDVLNLARLQMGKGLELNRQPMDLVALVRRAVQEQQQATDRNEIVFDSSLAELHGWLDTARIERTLANLLSNALKYSPHGGTVTVALEREGADEASIAVVRVADHGIGIPATDLPHVFDRFHRASNVIGRISGTGVGLAIVQQVVQEHGGTISVESIEGEGTTFTVRLPVAEVSEPMGS